ncbi:MULTISPECIES: hypothetical protein [Mangrovibacter]|uniref:hypothetical protein n=1 Tax=Mangrovibacter TaxID=451512 RepID=UPI0011B3EF71|nr:MULTISPECIES: hypothetical protein [Mangrovibacter]
MIISQVPFSIQKSPRHHNIAGDRGKQAAGKIVLSAASAFFPVIRKKKPEVRAPEPRLLDLLSAFRAIRLEGKFYCHMLR